MNDAGCADVGTGAPQGDRSRGIELKALSAPTPETDKTTHYFFSFIRNFGHDDPDVQVIFDKGLVDVFREDIVVFEAQQKMLDCGRPVSA